MVTNKYILQKIFNQTFNVIERCEIDYIHYLLVKLILVSKSFGRDVLCSISYPTLNIGSVVDLKKCLFFIKRGIPLLFSINIPQNRSNSPYASLRNNTIVRNCVYSLKSIFNQQEKLLWDQISDLVFKNIKCFASYDNMFLSSTQSYDRLEMIFIEDPINNKSSNTLLNLINSNTTAFPQFKHLLLIENDNNSTSPTISATSTSHYFDPLSADTCNKLTTLKIQSTREFQSFSFIQRFKYIKVLYLDIRIMTDEHYGDIIGNVNIHQHIQDLTLMFHSNVKIDNYDFLGNANITRLTLSHYQAPVEFVQTIINNNKQLKYLSIVIIPIVFMLDKRLRKQIDTTVNNNTLEEFTLRGLTERLPCKWTECSNIRYLNIDQLVPNISTIHPHLRMITIHTIFEHTEQHQIKSFLQGLEKNLTIEYLEIDIKVREYSTNESIFPDPIEFLTALFNLFPTTNIRHFKFNLRGYEATTKDFNLQDQLLQAIKNNQRQLYSLFLNTISSGPIINDCNLLFTILESLEYIQLFECNQPYSLTDKQYLRFKNSISQLKFLKFLDIQLVLNSIYQQNLKNYLSSLGIFSIIPKNKMF